MIPAARQSRHRIGPPGTGHWLQSAHAKFFNLYTSLIDLERNVAAPYLLYLAEADTARGGFPLGSRHLAWHTSVGKVLIM
jgi:hypothetical protein